MDRRSSPRKRRLHSAVLFSSQAARKRRTLCRNYAGNGRGAGARLFKWRQIEGRGTGSGRDHAMVEAESIRAPVS